MSLGLIGRKLGMMRIFADQGQSIPVTVLKISKNNIVQVKTKESDGYFAAQVAFDCGDRNPKNMTKAELGHYASAGVDVGLGLVEFPLSEKEASSVKVGDEISLSAFNAGQLVDVTGVSKGRGFSGTIKRHNFGAQRTSHGNSRSHRVPGSIGMAQDPGRVFKGKKMAGQYGNIKITVQNLEIVRIDEEQGLLFIKGGIPGSVNGKVVVRSAVKAGV